MAFKEIINNYDDGFSGYNGFSIITNRQEIELLISNYQSCCENWGYFMNNDDLPSFIGSNILSVEITNTVLKTQKIDDMDETSYWKGTFPHTMFVNIYTDIGTLQFVAYNSHNGSYGHEAKVICKQLQHACSLWKIKISKDAETFLKSLNAELNQSGQ